MISILLGYPFSLTKSIAFLAIFRPRSVAMRTLLHLFYCSLFSPKCQFIFVCGKKTIHAIMLIRASTSISPISARRTASAPIGNPRKIKKSLKSKQQKRTDDLKSSVPVREARLTL